MHSSEKPMINEIKYVGVAKRHVSKKDGGAWNLG
jgi:hypothetical protein